MSTTTISDPVLAVGLYLRSEIGEQFGNRVFESELPEGEDSNMPRTSIVIVPNDGYALAGGNYLRFVDTIMDFYCYGSTRLEAQKLGRAALTAMRELTESTWNGVQLYWARPSAGVKVEMDPKANWPTGVFTCQVAHSQEPIEE